MTASRESRTFARLKKQVMPPLLEFIKDETLLQGTNAGATTETITHMIVLFGETLAAFTHAYKAEGTPEETWAFLGGAMREVFLDTSKYFNETQDNETDHPTQA